LGIGVGYAVGQLYRRGWVPEYLKGPFALVAALGVYLAGNVILSEGGLLAATLLGLTLGNMNLPSIDEIRRFKEYIALILVSGVFILLAADFKFTGLLVLDWRAGALLAIIIFVVRPLSIWLSTIHAGMSWQERTLLAWIAPRGIVAAAVAGVIGPALVKAGYPDGETLLPLIFTLILLTVTLHGFTIGILARRLGLSAEGANGVLIVGASPWTIGLAEVLKGKDVPVMIVDSSWHRLRPARLGGIPVYYGDVLSEASEQRLEFNDYGCLLAATDNDAYNAMVCTHFATEMSRNRVFQLPDVSSEESDPKRLPRTRRGVIILSEKAWYEDLLSNWYRGWIFKKTLLTDEFDFDQLVASLPEEAMPLAAVRENGIVNFFSPEQPLKPKAGDTVIWFGPATNGASTNSELRVIA
jgi:Sodium/hydrogen exchanger family/TrkA-N domain